MSRFLHREGNWRLCAVIMLNFDMSGGDSKDSITEEACPVDRPHASCIFFDILEHFTGLHHALAKARSDVVASLSELLLEAFAECATFRVFPMYLHGLSSLVGCRDASGE